MQERKQPTALRERIATDVRAVAADPMIVARLVNAGSVARGSTPAEFAAAIEDQRAKVADIARAVGAKPAQSKPGQ
jgi:tripartite-type tricarboxylate transporter receptor subunit TctC